MFSATVALSIQTMCTEYRGTLLNPVCSLVAGTVSYFFIMWPQINLVYIVISECFVGFCIQATSSDTFLLEVEGKCLPNAIFIEFSGLLK